MFSYPAGVWQMRAAERAENQFNGDPNHSAAVAIWARLATIQNLIDLIIFLRWTLAQSSFTVELLRRPAQQPASEADVCMPALPSVSASLLTPLFLHSI